MNPMGTSRRWTGSALAMLAAGGLLADDAAWSKSAAGTYDWTNAVNWLPGTACPDGAGQAAYLTNDIAGTQTIQLRRNITLGALAAGDAAAAAGSFGFTLNNKSGEAFMLTLDSGAAGSAATILVGSSGTPTLALNAPMALGSDLLVNMAGIDSANRHNVSFGAGVELNGHAITFTNGVSGQNQISFEAASAFTGSGTIINNSQTVVSLTGGKAFGGTLIANRGAGGSNTGSFTLTNGGFTNAAEFVINGYLLNGSTQVGGSIHSGNNSSFVNNPGQRWTTKQVTLNGGSLDDGGQAASNNSGNPTNNWQRGLEFVQDNVATVTLNSSYSYFGVNASSTTTGTLFNVGTLVRQPGATVYMNGPNTSNKLFVAGNGASYLKGAGGAAGSKTMSVIPWAGVYVTGGTANPPGFGTYVEGSGFRGITDAEYTNRVMAGAEYNVSVDNVVLTNDFTVNSLRMGYLNAPNNNIGTNRTLTVASGGVYFQIGDRLLGSTNSPNAGTLNFGSVEGVVWVIGANTNIIGAKITGAGGLTKTGTGVLTLTGANSYSGTNHVSGGTLRVGDGTYGSNVGSGDVHVHVGAVLCVSCPNALSDNAKLILDRYGLFNARMHLEAGVNATVRFLQLGGVGQPSGTYGASGSGAATTRDDYFTGTGVLTVTGQADANSSGTVIRVL